MNETTKNFWKAIQEYKEPETLPVIWKLLFDPETGKPIDVSAANDVEGTWIEISREEADKLPQFNPRVRVRNGKIEYIKLPCDEQGEVEARPNRLVKTENGQFISDPWNMLFVSEEGNHWDYARRS